MPSGNELGIIFAVIASVSGAMGNLLFRLSWKSERWPRTIRLLGLLTVVSADPFRILSFGYGESKVVAPFSSLSLVWLILLANPIAGDKPSHVDIVGSLVIAGGVALVAAFGTGGGDGDDDGDDEFLWDEDDTESQLQTVVSEFNGKAQRPEFVFYLVAQAVFLLVSGVTVATGRPEKLVVKVCWGALGGVLQVGVCGWVGVGEAKYGRGGGR